MCLFLCCFISVLYRHSLTSHLMIKLFTSMLRLKILPLFEHIMHVSSLSESTLCIALCISGILPPCGTGVVPSFLCHALPPSYKGVCLSPSCEPPAHGLHVQAKEQWPRRQRWEGADLPLLTHVRSLPRELRPASCHYGGASEVNSGEGFRRRWDDEVKDRQELQVERRAGGVLDSSRRMVYGSHLCLWCGGATRWWYNGPGVLHIARAEGSLQEGRMSIQRHKTQDVMLSVCYPWKWHPLH
jgi:hypothetical protein